MGDANHQHSKHFVLDFVHNAISADSEPAQPAEVSLQGGAEIGGLRELVNGGDEPRPGGFGDPPQVPGRATLNPY